MHTWSLSFPGNFQQAMDPLEDACHKLDFKLALQNPGTHSVCGDTSLSVEMVRKTELETTAKSG